MVSQFLSDSQSVVEGVPFGLSADREGDRCRNENEHDEPDEKKAADRRRYFRTLKSSAFPCANDPRDQGRTVKHPPTR